MSRTLTDDDIGALAEAVAIKVSERLNIPPPSPTLTKAEAMHLAKRKRTAFSEWCALWQVEKLGRNRYSRRSIEIALRREAGELRVPASLKREQEATR